MFDERKYYMRDDEMDEFGDTGAYGDPVEEDFEEEEEESDVVMTEDEESPEPVMPAAVKAPPAKVAKDGPFPMKTEVVVAAPKKAAPKKPAAKKAAKKKTAKKKSRR